MGGDLSEVIDSASRRPRTSMCLVMASSRPVPLVTPAFQSNPGLPRFHPRSLGILSTILGKSLIRYLTLSPQAHALVANLLSLIPTIIKIKRNLPSMSFYESHRRQPSITRFARLNKQRSGDLSLFRSAPKS